MNFKKIRYSVSKGIASIVLDSPKNLNALDEAMIDDLLIALDMCAEDDSVKVIVISGAGKGFSAGGDIGMMYKGIKGEELDFVGAIEKVGKVSLKIKKLLKPVIAAVSGPVAGAGFNVALACDFRIAAENTNFIQAFVNIGLVPDAGGVYLLTRAIGVAKTTELIMTGKPIDANTALGLGLVNKVVVLEKLKATVENFALKLASGPSLAYAGMKDLIFESEYKEFESFIAKEVEHQVRCGQSEDFKEGVTAFIEKRKANFQGK
ncbi:enoyl-CoA hydratase/isomerase family protein [Paramaledivibacter caminithermalis]|uniref:Enoyl-CoA hydratase n=1 Tax=Paramaledivibacter caminithermalis (strain DSM 15212 / CIP 107654 / DViRD3) TaxID=1121301 RepID=A0A1M6MXQ5_PARC5|nr:enoyl-CoA hydratase [Paramaledivibacter caminithermalis]SHJ88174.1 Enoyl-CoA hydratase [Paramaledivibacter caminithermalis DSM 15212]